MYYPYSVLANECNGGCNDINNFLAKLCAPDVVKDTNIKVFNQISRTNETRYASWHETCKCKCRLYVSVCNNKQRWNKDKCRCECKELIDKGRFDEVFIWNPSKSECDKSCDVGQYLDHETCKCKKKLINKLAQECSENIDGNELICNATLNDYRNACNSCTIYIVLLVIFFVISIDISFPFIYFHWYLKKSNTSITNINANTETVIY